VQNTPKITPADYPDLLAAVDAGTPQRELADRYGCAPSLVARHVARAKRARELSEPARGRDPGLTADPHTGSMREILEARIRDPKTSSRDIASLAGALSRLEGEEDAPPAPTTGQPVTCPECGHTFPSKPAELPRGVIQLYPSPLK
jgi:hypothetical protein